VLPCIRRALGPAQLQAAVKTERSGGADSNRRLGGHSPALCRLSYAPGRSEVGSNLRRRDSAVAGLAPQCLTTRPPLRNGAPGRCRLDDLPLTRRVLSQLSYRSGIAGAGFEPAPVAAYEAAALPLSYPAAPCRRRDLNPHGPSPRRSERRASAVSPRRRFQGNGFSNGFGGNRTRCALGFNQPLYR
jgi:hypothetical protein